MNDTGSGKVLDEPKPGAVAVPEHLKEQADKLKADGISVWDETHPYVELREWAKQQKAMRDEMMAQAAQKISQDPELLAKARVASQAQPGSFTLSTVAGPDGTPIIMINDKPATPQQLAALGAHFKNAMAAKKKLRRNVEKKAKKAIARKKAKVTKATRKKARKR